MIRKKKIGSKNNEIWAYHFEGLLTNYIGLTINKYINIYR
jgi:hypothetical protein